MLKKLALTMLLLFTAAVFQPAPAYAGFFLTNIINSIFSGGKNTPPPPPQEKAPAAAISVIKFGMNNSQVVSVQEYLIRAKYLGGRADGIFGYQTLQAVRLFQRERGLTDDGVVGPKTMAALKSYKGSRPKAPPPPPRKPSPPKKSGGVPEYLYTVPMLVTAYTRYDEGCTDYTYRGTYLRRGLVAVDPDVIPLGTRLYVPGYGEALADDIGGAIIGNHIDLAMDTQNEAFEWGKRNLTVYVLN